MKRLFLIVTCFSIAYGQQNAEFRYVEDCYSAGDTLTLEAKYNGSGTPTAVQWSYSEETSSNLVIATATCTVFASVPTGFPQVSRLNYTCESVHSLPSNTYRLTVTGLQSSELNNSWGATFTPPVGTSPAAVQVALPLCDTTSTTPSSSSTSTSTASTVTSTTPTSTSTTPVSKSTTPTLTSVTASTTTTSTSSVTASVTKAIPEATTASSDSSSSETVVIIVVSVVGGLFAVGIVITIVLMLLKRKKPDSKAIHNYKASRNTGEFQRPKSLGSVGHSKHSGSHFKQNPLYVRHSNQSVAYQYQPWNGRHNSRSLRYIYPGLASGEQYSGIHVGRDRRVNETPDYYNPGNHRRQQYYIHSSDTHRSKSRPPTLETLQIDDQNYVAANYSTYW